MTLSIRRNTSGGGEVENTESTEVAIGQGQVRIGGSLKNTGKVRVLEGGILEVSEDFLNEGHLYINDPGVIMEALRTTKSVAEFGTEVLKKVGLLQ